MNGEPSWDLLRTFAAVLREGSLSGAGRSLGLTQPTVARHVEGLEAAVGGALFLRGPRGLSPTPRAEALAPYAQALEGVTAAFLRTASGDPDEVAGGVRVTASEMVAVKHLAPLLARLRRAHPALTLELVASDAVEDLLQRSADIAVRMTPPVQQALLKRPAGQVTLGLYARTDYLDRRGRPSDMGDLRGLDLIGPDAWTPLMRRACEALGGLERSDFALRTDSTLAQAAAVRAGFGVGVCQVEVAGRDARLERVLPDAFGLPLPMWVVMHEDLRHSRGCRAVFDVLATGLATRVQESP